MFHGQLILKFPIWNKYMYKKGLTISSMFLFISLFLTGYLLTDNLNLTDPYFSRNLKNNLSKDEYLKKIKDKSEKNINIERDVSGAVYYQDDFDGANDTSSLKNRGYKIFFRSGGAQGISPIWFQGNSLVFNSFNGPSSGYLASNYQVISNANNLDNWLILPRNNTSAGDSIIFYSRSVLNSNYPDSLRVMFSQNGDSLPEGSWSEIGRFKASVDGNWKRIAYRVSSSGAASRFAIRYNVVNGGPGGVNSDYIGIDALTLEKAPGANDMAVLSIDSPKNNVYFPFQMTPPKATFKNIGSSPQFNIPVTFKITGPVNYTSNKIIPSLPSGEFTQGIFDSTFFPVAGNYNVSVYSSLASDGFRGNDTLKLSFTAINLNYGNSASYFYANSTVDALQAPSKPKFCWKDTSGSTNLVINNFNINPAIFTGDLDDGFWKITLPSGKKVRFYGNNYDTIRIGTNGIISFQNFDPGSGNWAPPPTGIPGGEVTNALYPLWNDFDFSNSIASPTNRISYKVNGSQLIITFDRAPIYDGGPGNYVSFQVTMDVSAGPLTNSRVLYQYSDTTAGKTGQSFITNLNANSFQSHLIGFQNSSFSQAMTYRFRDQNGLVTPGKIFASGSESLSFQTGPDASQLSSACMNLDLTGRLQVIQLTRKDTLTISIRSNNSPFELIETEKKVYDTLSGLTSIPVYMVNPGSAYYLEISHRNSITTWSSTPVLFSDNITNYDFSTGISQAFGNNLININGKSSFYTGDISRDGCVDLSDLVAVVNNTTLFTTGEYVLEDLNFDELVDLTDLVGCHNNTSIFVCTIAP
jgi:hypothetical protein